MIVDFRCKDTEKLFNDKYVRKFTAIERPARRKLEMIDAAHNVEDLKSPPGNRLESLRGDRKGQYSIRINNKFRICFIWDESGARDVEIVDYH